MGATGVTLPALDCKQIVKHSKITLPALDCKQIVKHC